MNPLGATCGLGILLCDEPGLRVYKSVSWVESASRRPENTRGKSALANGNHRKLAHEANDPRRCLIRT